jgi:hypothetical protein
MNGISSLALATANDTRALEAAAHAWAARDGSYRSLSRFWIDGDNLYGYLKLPLAFGTVGGASASTPPPGRRSKIMGNPGAMELARYAAALGLAQNFSAISALAGEGIQQGHMRLHAGRLAYSAGARAGKFPASPPPSRNRGPTMCRRPPGCWPDCGARREDGHDGQGRRPSEPGPGQVLGKTGQRTQSSRLRSIGISLGAFTSRTDIRLRPATGDKLSYDVRINGEVQNPAAFHRFFAEAMRWYGGPACHLDVDSVNDFPTAAGLASSASGFAALARRS